MSIIKPFRGICYNPARAGNLSRLIAPPYDIISAEHQDALHERSPYNVVRLILGKEPAADKEENNKYTRAAALWRQWQEEKILIRSQEPAIYWYELRFEINIPEGLVCRERPGFIALLKLHEYEERKVLPHERTLAGPKEDRFRLLLATRVNFCAVFVLYPDPRGETEKVLKVAPPAGTNVMEAEDDYGVIHRMWPITERAAIEKVTAHLEQHRLYLADGHHRYETALALRRHLLRTTPLFAAGADYLLAYFTPIEHPGLVIFPYHRLLHHLPKRRLTGLLKKLDPFFSIQPTLRSPLEPGVPRRDFLRELQERRQQQPTFGLIDGRTRTAYFLALKPDARPLPPPSSPLQLTLSQLDVVLLEEVILKGILQIKPHDLLNEKFVRYETDADRAFAAVESGLCQLAFLLNPTPIEDIITVAEQGGVMPEKSTYFFPKIATGLVMRDLVSS